MTSPSPSSPGKILDLGAYAGFAAVFLAQRFPDAEIVCIEPSAENFRLLVLNTSAYPNIKLINAAIWSKSRTLHFDRSTPGDWGMRVVTSGSRSQELTALSLSEILELIHWDSIDFLKCDIEGAEREVFARAANIIANSVKCCAIELHEITTPGSEGVVSACFDSANFDHTRSGGYDVYTRRDVERTSPDIPVIHVLRPPTGIREISLVNVPTEGWGFYVLILFHVSSMQLARIPNPPR